MLFISILITLLIVWETAQSTANFEAETNEAKANYFFLKTIYSLLICAIIWGHYMGRREERKLIEQYEKGCPQFEQINEPIYHIKK